MNKRYVTVTGRAIGKGQRVTRATYGVRRKHSGRPLPMDLQVHPVALTHTPVHPQCHNIDDQYGYAVQLRKLPRALLLGGSQLPFKKGKVGMWAVEFPDWMGVVGYTWDLHLAMGHKLAAKHHGFKCNVYQLVRNIVCVNRKNSRV